jgi:hypothetical protein
MTYEFTAHGFETPPDLIDFARITTLFEVWRPRQPWLRLAIQVRSAALDHARFRCRIDLEGCGETIRAEAIAEDAYEVVRAAAEALCVPARGPGTSEAPTLRSGPGQPSGSPSVTQPCEAS